MGFNILLVDDSSLTRKKVRRIIEMAELEVGDFFEAENGAEALKVLDESKIDLVLSLDIGTGPTVDVFDEMGATRVFDPEKIVMVNDHFTPAKDIASAELSKKMRSFARKQ